MTQDKSKVCNWCGKEAVTYYNGEMLCENCIKFIYIEAEKKEKNKQRNSV